MTNHPEIARVRKRDAAPAGGPSSPLAPSSPSTGAAPIPAAAARGSVAGNGVVLPGIDHPQLAGRVAVCPADFSEIDGEDYDGRLDGARSYDRAMAYFREVHSRNPDAPELGKGRW